jgi:hypothetical protein
VTGQVAGSSAVLPSGHLVSRLDSSASSAPTCCGSRFSTAFSSPGASRKAGVGVGKVRGRLALLASASPVPVPPPALTASWLGPRFSA